MIRRGPATVLAVAWLSAACGAPLMKLPSGPGTTAPDAAAALDQAIAACRTIRTLTAEVGVRGSANAHRVSGRMTLGVAAPASVRIEAVAPFGQPLFIFVATGNEATLLLPRDDRVLERGRPDAVLEAIAGVPLGASDLRSMITGCASGAAVDSPRARALGADWRLFPTGRDGELYLHRERSTAPWRLVVAIARTENGRSWRADYSDFRNDLPSTIHLTSAGSSAYDLRLALSQVETNVPLDASVFRVQIPSSAQPITLEELRDSGPLAAKSDGR